MEDQYTAEQLEKAMVLMKARGKNSYEYLARPTNGAVHPKGRGAEEEKHQTITGAYGAASIGSFFAACHG